MKMLWVLAGLVGAGTVLGQSEQWLAYQTSSQGRAYQMLQVESNAPPGVALPRLHAHPLFAHWMTPMDASGGRWLCLDRTHPSGLYDRLYIDANGNGRLDDETPVKGRIDFSSAFFPPTPLIFKGSDGPITYHILFRFYQFDNGRSELLASSAGWYEGLVNFGGVKKHIQLIDGNVNGAFNDIAPNFRQSDVIAIDGDNAGQRYLGRMIEVDGKLFRIEVSKDGAFVKVQKAEDVTLGTVRVPSDISEFTAYGENGYFIRKPVNGQFSLPAGQYRMFRWTIQRKDSRSVPWTLSGYNFPDSANFEVSADKAASLEIGEPIRALLTSANTSGRQIAFSLRFQGQQKEPVEMLRNGQRPAGPKLSLVDDRGALAATRSFQFG